MKTIVEFRSFMSRPELFLALTICAEAAGRLSPRMTAADRARLRAAAIRLYDIADGAPPAMEPPNRAALGPPTEETASA